MHNHRRIRLLKLNKAHTYTGNYYWQWLCWVEYVSDKNYDRGIRCGPFLMPPPPPTSREMVNDFLGEWRGMFLLWRKDLFSYGGKDCFRVMTSFINLSFLQGVGGARGEIKAQIRSRILFFYFLGFKGKAGILFWVVPTFPLDIKWSVPKYT